MIVDTMAAMNGFWTGLGFWAGSIAFFIFCLVVTGITSFIIGILDRGKEKKDGEK